MSKKSRKRNRRILKALAVGLGTAALMRGRGTPAAANVDSGRSGDSSSALARFKANTPVTGTEYPGANQATVAKTSYGKGYGHPIIQGNVNRKKSFVSRAEGAKRARLSAMNAVPPSMRGGAEAAQGYLRKIPSRGQYPGGWTDKPGGWSSQFKKGGRVKLAKRGLGRAFTKNKK